MGDTMTSCCNQHAGPGGLNAEIQITPSDKSALNIPLGSFRRCDTMKPTDQGLQETLQKALKYRSVQSNKQTLQQLWVMDIKNDNKTEQIYVKGKDLDTQVNGEVKIYFPRGQIFQGNIVNRQPVEGAFVFKRGCFYVGKIQKFNAEGFGRYESNDSGYIYEGNWSRSLPHGKGKQTYKNGDSFEGEIMYGEKFGEGVYKFADGKIYQGSFYYNQSDGVGKITYPNHESYEGQWKLGKFHGKGKFIFKNGQVYEGSYHEGKRQGLGKYTFRGGCWYQGGWENGHQAGRGVFHQGYDEVEGQWSHGQLMS